MLKDMAFSHLQKKLGDKYGKKNWHCSKKAGIDAAKIFFKRIFQKTAEATGDLIENKIAGEITLRSRTRERKRRWSKWNRSPPVKNKESIDA